MKGIASAIGICIVWPIWLYLIYQVLVRVNASELMWFLFWVYVPAGLFVRGVTEYAEKRAK